MIGPWVGGALAGVIYRFGVEVRPTLSLYKKYNINIYTFIY